MSSTFKIKKSLLLGLVGFIIFLFSSLYITYPLIFHLGDYTTGLGDELLIAWIHTWVIHALITNPFALFNANILFPYHNTLAYSDVFFTGSIITFPFVYFIGQPIVANNVTLILSLTLLGFSLYLLSFYITKNFLVSLIAGLLVQFSPATLNYAVHIQVLEVYWVPFAILSFLVFFNSRKTRYFISSLLCFLLQFYNSFLPAYFILFSFIIIAIFKWFENKKIARKFLTKKNIALIVIVLALMLPIIIPYYSVSKEFHYVRDIRDSIHFALQPEDLLYPGDTTRLKGFLLTVIPTNHFSQNNEFKAGYLGVSFSILIIVSVVYFLLIRKKATVYEKSFLTIALLGLVLSFGPFLHLNRQTVHHPFPIPLPYALFYYIMPGFQGFRNSERWEMLFILAIAVFIAIAVSRLTMKFRQRNKIILSILLIMGIVIEFSPFQFFAVPQKKDFPKVFSWMATTPQQTVFIFMPIYNWNMQPYANEELLREYFSTLELRPMLNGYSGFSPPPWQEFIYTMHKSFPKRSSIKQLHQLGINYIIIDKIFYDKEYNAHTSMINGSMVISQLKTEPEVSFVKAIGEYYIFAVK